MQKLYPWEDWLGKPRTVILRGVHYRCSQASMAQSIRNAASQRGVRVRVVDTNTEIIIEVKDETRGELPVSSDSNGPPVRLESCPLPQG